MDRYGIDIQRAVAENVEEPVSLERLKSFLGVDFADFDDTLKLYIKQARQQVEDYCGISLVTQTVTLTAEYWSGSYPLPYPNVVSVTSVKDLSDNALTYTRIGNRINVDAESGCTVVYVTGGTVPENANTLIIFIAACLYDKELIPIYQEQIKALKKELKRHS